MVQRKSCNPSGKILTFFLQNITYKHTFHPNNITPTWRIIFFHSFVPCSVSFVSLFLHCYIHSFHHSYWYLHACRTQTTTSHIKTPYSTPHLVKWHKYACIEGKRYDIPRAYEVIVYCRYGVLQNFYKRTMRTMHPNTTHKIGVQYILFLSAAIILIFDSTLIAC